MIHKASILFPTGSATTFLNEQAMILSTASNTTRCNYNAERPAVGSCFAPSQMPKQLTRLWSSISFACYITIFSGAPVLPQSWDMDRVHPRVALGWVTKTVHVGWDELDTINSAKCN